MIPYSKWLEVITSSFNEILETFIKYLPNVLGAVLLFLFGWLIAYVLKRITFKTSKGLNKLYHSSPLGRATSSTTSEHRFPVSRFLSAVVFWLTLVFFFTASIEILGFPGVSKWVQNLYAYLPNIAACFAIIFIGYLLSLYVKDSIIETDVEHAALLAQVGWLSVILLAFLFGAAQLGINIFLVTNIITIVIGAILGAGALAFGIGSANSVSNIIASHYIRRNYQLGNIIQVGDAKGQIAAFMPTLVVLETDAGKIMVPAKQFYDHAVIVMD